MNNPSHLLPLLLLFIPVCWGIYGYIKTRGTKNKVRYPGFALIFNSAILYALAFNIIFFIQELFLALGKRWLGLKAVLYHNNHNWYGEHPMDHLAQGCGAVAIFITAIICLIIARAMKDSKHWLQLFFLWMSFQGFAQSIPQFITAFMAPDTDTGQAFTYLGLSQLAGWIISIMGIALMLWIGSLFTKYLLQLSPAGSIGENPGSRFGYLFRIAILASIMGMILIVPFRIMPWERALAPVFVTLLSIPMVFAHAWKIKPLASIDNDVNKKILMMPVILLIVLLLIFQLILAKGVEM
ncbi:MAG TPA: hypothetical protein VF144_09750 [Chitinophagaceae bacterium]